MSNEEEIPSRILNDLLTSMFAISPIAMSITTSDGHESRYLRVNDAYLKLVGRSWSELSGLRVAEKTVQHNEARARRHQRLQQEGGYVGEYVEIRRADGIVVPTLISAQRSIIEGIHYDVEVIVDISSRVNEQREHEAQLAALARTDSLSGLPNRRAFDERLALTDTAPSEESHPTLALLDLNGFKAINDEHGHQAGDEIIRVVGQRLRAALADGDFVARIGGDEFAILFAAKHQDLASADAEHIVQIIAQPIRFQNSALTVGAAIGVARRAPGEDAETLYRRADAQMYAMKRSSTR